MKDFGPFTLRRPRFGGRLEGFFVRLTVGPFGEEQGASFDELLRIVPH